MSIENQCSKYIQEDIERIRNLIESQYNVEVLSADPSTSCYDIEDSEICEVELALDTSNGNATAIWSYGLDSGSDDVWMSEDVEEIVLDIGAQLGKTAIESATNIFGADEDDPFENDDFGDEDIADEDGVNDALDSMADNIEDIQDQVEDVQEDDVSIELDNNISDHYIAECDKCKGIFISAVIESDQVVDSITGVCPLCEEETEQHLNWVIKKVER